MSTGIDGETIGNFGVELLIDISLTSCVLHVIVEVKEE
jgi:hypothetical protein